MGCVLLIMIAIVLWFINPVLIAGFIVICCIGWMVKELSDSTSQSIDENSMGFFSNTENSILKNSLKVIGKKNKKK